MYMYLCIYMYMYNMYLYMCIYEYMHVCLYVSICMVTGYETVGVSLRSL